MFIRAYLRASVEAQDASRAEGPLHAFVADRGLKIAATYKENESGTTLARPELFRLLSDCQPGDVLLVEQVDRLSRLTEGDWKTLRAAIDAKEVRIVALDLPTSWGFVNPHTDEFTSRMFGAINGMLLDVLAAVARKDYDDRRRRQAQGQAKAKTAGLYRGRKEDKDRNDWIASMLRDKKTWSQIQAATKCSRATVAKVAKRLDAGKAA